MQCNGTANYVSRYQQINEIIASIKKFTKMTKMFSK